MTINSIAPKDLKCWLSAIFLGLLGFFLNFAKIALFFNIDMIVGGIVVILSLKYCGKKGILSALIASSATYFIWNHPYAIIIFTAEAVVISYFAQDDQDIIFVDLIYWVSVGIILVFVFYFIVMHVSLKSTYIIMLKQSINGVLNTTLASILYHLINYICKQTGRKYRLVSFRSVFFKIFVIAAFLPSMMFIMLSVKSDNNKMSQVMQSTLSSFLITATSSADEFLSDVAGREQLIADTAKEYNYQYTTAALNKLRDNLSKMMMSTDTFTDMGVIDNNYNSLAFIQKNNGKIIKLNNINFSDKDYYSEIRNTDKTYISNVYKDNSGNNKNIVMLMPLKDKNGLTAGYVQGSIDFAPLYNQLKRLSKEINIYFTLVDRHSEIILSTNPEFKKAAKYSDIRMAGDITPLSEGIYQWTPPTTTYVTYMTRWQKSFYVGSSDLSKYNGLRLIAEYPLTQYVDTMNNKGVKSLMIIAIMILSTVSAAWFISRSISSRLTELTVNTIHLPDKVYNSENIKWSDTIFSEIKLLTDNFIEMQQQLNVKFFQLNQKTHELHIILDSIPLVIFLKNTRNCFIMGNKAASEYLGIPQDDFDGKPASDIFPDNFEKLYQDDLQVIKTAAPVIKIIQTYKTPGGDRTVMTDKIPILGHDGHVTSILIISQDITDEIKAGEERQRTLDALYQQSKMAEMGAMIGAIAHQWKQPLNTAAMITQVIQSDAEDGNIDKESLIESTVLLMDNINFMSQTVSDFTSYFKQNKEKQIFKPCETVKEIYALIDRQFVKHDITVVFHEHEHFEIDSFRNEFKQVCLNILNNAKDALIDSDVKNKRIDVKYKTTKDTGVIIISDNGGGIAEDLLPDKLFEPYHSTKGEKGTGIGLYICKNIVEQHIGGTITARNVDGGAEFTITLPI